MSDDDSKTISIPNFTYHNFLNDFESIFSLMVLLGVNIYDALDALKLVDRDLIDDMTRGFCIPRTVDEIEKVLIFKRKSMIPLNQIDIDDFDDYYKKANLAVKDMLTLKKCAKSMIYIRSFEKLHIGVYQIMTGGGISPFPSVTDYSIANMVSGTAGFNGQNTEYISWPLHICFNIFANSIAPNLSDDEKGYGKFIKTLVSSPYNNYSSVLRNLKQTSQAIEADGDTDYTEKEYRYLAKYWCINVCLKSIVLYNSRITNKTGDARVYLHYLAGIISLEDAVSSVWSRLVTSIEGVDIFYSSRGFIFKQHDFSFFCKVSRVESVMHAIQSALCAPELDRTLFRTFPNYPGGQICEFYDKVYIPAFASTGSFANVVLKYYGDSIRNRESLLNFRVNIKSKEPQHYENFDYFKRERKEGIGWRNSDQFFAETNRALKDWNTFSDEMLDHVSTCLGILSKAFFPPLGNGIAGISEVYSAFTTQPEMKDMLRVVDTMAPVFVKTLPNKTNQRYEADPNFCKMIGILALIENRIAVDSEVIYPTIEEVNALDFRSLGMKNIKILKRYKNWITENNVATGSRKL